MKNLVFNVIVVLIIVLVSLFGPGDIPNLALPLLSIQIAVNTFYIVEKSKKEF